MSALDALFRSLSNRMGMGAPLKFDAEGHICLCIDGDLYMDLQCTEDQQTLHAYVALGHVPLAAPAALWKQMLQANLFGAGTGGATLAIDELGQEILLARSFDVESTTVDALAVALEKLIASSLSWREKLAQTHRDHAEDSAAPAMSRRQQPLGLMINNA